MKRFEQALDGVVREHVLRAVLALRSTDAAAVGAGAGGVVYFEGHRWPMRAIGLLAVELSTGLRPTLGKFSPSDDAAMARCLRRCGFTVVQTGTEAEVSIAQAVREILHLQTQYSSHNTEPMQRRGELVRRVLPGILRRNAARLEPSFSKLGYSMEAEGKDGIGRKVESAWARIFDAPMSPSATTGWYVVLHFSRKGDFFYAAISCGATRFVNGDFVSVAPSDLLREVEWAREVATSKRFPIDDFSDAVELHGNDLSGQFERAIPLARRFDVEKFDEQEFWQCLEQLVDLLVHLYEAERLGKSPAAAAPEVASASSEIDLAVSTRPKGIKGQGRGLSFEERRAVELRAMAVATEELARLGFTEIVDVSRTESCDLRAKRDDSEWLIEVKGTTSPSADLFLLTAPELALHRAHQGRTVLVLICDINLERGSAGARASDGRIEVQAPWDCEAWSFEPTAFRAKRR